jgi:hypothetical protein
MTSINDDAPVNLGDSSPINLGDNTPVNLGDNAPVNLGDAPVNLGDDAPVNLDEQQQETEVSETPQHVAPVKLVQALQPLSTDIYQIPQRQTIEAVPNRLKPTPRLTLNQPGTSHQPATLIQPATLNQPEISTQSVTSHQPNTTVQNEQKEIVKIFVKGMHVGGSKGSIQAEDLRAHFSPFGEVVNVWTCPDERTFGFVEMYGKVAALTAISSLNQVEWKGAKLMVELAKPDFRSNSGGGQGNRSFLPLALQQDHIPKQGDWICACGINVSSV